MAFQARGVGALADSDVAGDLKLSDDQIAKLKTVGEELDKRRREMFEKMRESGGRGGFEEMRTKGEELRKEFDEKRLAILTDAKCFLWLLLKGSVLLFVCVV